jgi:hypothetical protein
VGLRVVKRPKLGVGEASRRIGEGVGLRIKGVPKPKGGVGESRSKASGRVGEGVGLRIEGVPKPEGGVGESRLFDQIVEARLSVHGLAVDHTRTVGIAARKLGAAGSPRVAILRSWLVDGAPSTTLRGAPRKAGIVRPRKTAETRQELRNPPIVRCCASWWGQHWWVNRYGRQWGPDTEDVGGLV